jgi:hypothetical protein
MIDPWYGQPPRTTRLAIASHEHTPRSTSHTGATTERRTAI